MLENALKFNRVYVFIALQHEKLQLKLKQRRGSGNEKEDAQAKSKEELVLGNFIIILKCLNKKIQYLLLLGGKSGGALWIRNSQY